MYNIVQTFVSDVNVCKASEDQMQCSGCYVSGVRGERVGGDTGYRFVAVW
jgi:hypothetical protein